MRMLNKLTFQQVEMNESNVSLMKSIRTELSFFLVRWLMSKKMSKSAILGHSLESIISYVYLSEKSNELVPQSRKCDLEPKMTILTDNKCSISTEFSFAICRDDIKMYFNWLNSIIEISIEWINSFCIIPFNNA